MTKKNIRHIAAFKADPELASETASTLNTLFGKPQTEPVYSIGFRRYTELTKTQRIALWKKYNFQTVVIKEALQTQTADELLSA